MSEVICRSPQEIKEDDLLKAHSNVMAALNATTRGGFGRAYVGVRRMKIKALRDRLERAILNPEEPEPAYGWGILVYSTLYL